MNGKSTADEVALWAMGFFGLFLLQRLWSTKIKPRLEEVIPAIKSGQEVALGSFSVSKVDLVVMGILAVAMLLAIVLVRSSLRSRRRRREQLRESARV